MKRTLRLDLTEQETKQAITEFARNKYQEEFGGYDDVVNDLTTDDVMFVIHDKSGTPCDVAQMCIEARAEIVTSVD